MAPPWDPAPVPAPVPGADAHADADPTAKKPNTGGWDALLIVDFVLVGIFALVVIATGLLSIFGGFSGAGTMDPDNTRMALWIQNALNLVVFGLIPFAWAAGTRVGGVGGALTYLRMDRAGTGVLWGIALWVGITVALAALALVLDRISPEITENPTLEGIGAALTWPLVFATALVAGVAEEIFFRGLLQRWIGLWGQAVAFGLLHASYGTVLQVVAPFALGLLFGLLVRRGMSLWAPITAHVLFDITSLSAAKYCSGVESTFCGG